MAVDDDGPQDGLEELEEFCLAVRGLRATYHSRKSVLGRSSVTLKVLAEETGLRHESTISRLVNKGPRVLLKPASRYALIRWYRARKDRLARIERAAEKAARS